ncbi:right-handed parallel beta-helix repeat-containing protein [Luteolibacter sp. Populi]|uniref:right-handed parallel beta-helix repeat-containing protein n=1 Tax=Luteolibacter sp. Populi TaxID=3230487 RepID=UPI0034650F4C
MFRIFVFTALVLAGPCHAAIIHLQPADKITDALAKAREIRRERPDEAIDIIFEEGVYRLTDALRLGPEDSGTEKGPLRLKAKDGAKVVISGGRRIAGITVFPFGGWQAKVEGPRFEQLWVGGRRAVRAREPNTGFFRMKGVKEEKLEGKARQTVEMPEDAIRWLRRLDAMALEKVQMLAYHKWDNTRRFIEKVEGSSFSTVGEEMKSWNRWDAKSGLVFENLQAGLDQPGEWFLSPEGVLTYLARPGEDPASSEIIAPVAERLLVIDGRPNAKVKHVEIRGLVFEHAGWTCPPAGFEPSQAAAPVEAVIQIDEAEQVTIENCEVNGSGLYGVWFRRGCVDCRLIHSRLRDLGAGGVRIGTMEPGKGTGRNVIEDCIIQDGGKVFPCAVGVWIGSSGDNRVRRNDIGYFPYTGVSVGWRWGYDASEAKRNAIEDNHIHHIGNGLLSDMGGIYTLGPSEGTVLRGNRIHDIVSYDYGGWGLYNDEGSTGILLENNLVYRTTTGGYHQHYGKENVIRNNIFAFARDQQLQFSRAEDHLSFRFTGNIVLWDKGPLWNGGAQAKGKIESDGNLYWRTDGGEIDCFGKKFADWQAAGHDGKSVVADPGFVDPAAGDFRFKDAGATAAKIGFKPFAFQAAGVGGDARWKGIADEIPAEWKALTPP